MIGRFCPQCGHRVAVLTHPLRGTNYADPEGFCLPARGHEQETGCAEHLVRFDAATGERLDAAPPRPRGADHAWGRVRDASTLYGGWNGMVSSRPRGGRMAT